MSWPTQQHLLDWMIRSTLILFIALVLDGLASRFTRLRSWNWPVAFGSIFLLFVPIPLLNIPLLEKHTDFEPSNPRVYELLPGYDYRKLVYLGDPIPSVWVVAFFGLVALGLIVLLLQVFLSWRLVKGAEQVTDSDLVSLVYEVSERYGLNDAPMVVLSDQVDSPCVIGVLNPTLVLPVKLVSSLDPDDLHLILSHELGHIKRRDNWKLFGLSLIRATLWWNPLMWFAGTRAIKRIEEANDRMAVLADGEATRYAKLLASHLVHAHSQNSLRFFGQGNVLSRIRSLGGGAGESSSWLATSALALLLIPNIKADLSIHPALNPNQIGYDEVVFSSNRDGKTAIWRMKSDGSSQTQFPKHFSNCIVPTISPDGKRIAYVKGNDWAKQDIYVSNIDGTGERLLVSTPARDYIPAWSPDSKYISFSTKVTGQWNIGIADVNTGKWHLLTKDSFGNLESSWHPNSKRIIFSSGRTQLQKIWSIDIDGKNLVRLTNGEFQDTGAKYSKDGRYVIYASYKRWKWDIWLLDLATMVSKPLSGMERLDTGEGRFVEGDTAVICSTRNNQDTQIGRTELDGTGFRVITFKGSTNGFPVTR